MRTKSSRGWIALTIALAGCSGGNETTAAGKPEGASIAETTAGAERPGLALVRAAPAEAIARGPVLSMYVQGPTPEGERPRGPGPRDFATDLVVINTGEESVDIADARASFDAWRGDSRRACETTSTTAGDEATGEGPDLGGPPRLGPGETITYRAHATCFLPKPGRYEVRAYLSFGADAPGFHRERHYVGRYYADVPR